VISRDPAEQDKAKRANDILADRDLALSVQVLQEFYDAAIIEASRAMGCTHVLSEDLNDGQDCGGIRVTNPFR
jgi:hypothetical protein